MKKFTKISFAIFLIAIVGWGLSSCASITVPKRMGTLIEAKVLASDLRAAYPDYAKDLPANFYRWQVINADHYAGLKTFIEKKGSEKKITSDITSSNFASIFERAGVTNSNLISELRSQFLRRDYFFVLTQSSGYFKVYLLHASPIEEYERGK